MLQCPYGSLKRTSYDALSQVWLDDHKELFYRFVPHARDIDIGDISSRVKLRKKLKCKSFDWYLENLLPMLPTEKRLLASGQVGHFECFKLKRNPHQSK